MMGIRYVARIFNIIYPCLRGLLNLLLRVPDFTCDDQQAPFNEDTRD